MQHNYFIITFSFHRHFWLIVCVAKTRNTALFPFCSYWIQFRKSTHPNLRDILWAEFCVLSSLSHSLSNFSCSTTTQRLMHTVFNRLVSREGSLLPQEVTSRSRNINKDGCGVNDIWTGSDAVCKQTWRTKLPPAVTWCQQTWRVT